MLIINDAEKPEFEEFLSILRKHGYKTESNIDMNLRSDYDCLKSTINLNISYKTVSWESNYKREPNPHFPRDKDEIFKKLKINMKSNQYSYTITDKSVTLFENARPFIAKSDHPNFKKIVSFVLKHDYEKAVGLFNIEKVIENKTYGKIQVKNGLVYYKDTVINNSVCQRIIEFLKNGQDINHLVKFLEKLLNNPSKYVFDNLYNYLNKYNLSIDQNGDIYAIKAVKYNLKSKWTDSVQYVIGETYSEPRALLRDDQNNSYCGPGLWFGHEQFVFNYGSGNDRVILVKVNPENVIAIPSNYHYQKMAACAITPVMDLGEINEVKNNFTFKSNSIYDVKHNGIPVVNKNKKIKRDSLGRFCKSA